MKPTDLKLRSKLFALDVIRLSKEIPQSVSGNIIAKQLVRAATSVGANYRAGCRSKSDRDFLNKMMIVEEESDESGYWLELLSESGLMSKDKIGPIYQESCELTAIFTASGRTIRERINRHPGK